MSNYKPLDDRQSINRSALSVSIGSSAGASLDIIFGLIDSKMVTLTGIQTITNKTINGANNTLNVRLATSDVSGVLPIANGGTDNGSLSVVAGGVIYTNGTNFQNSGAGTIGYALLSGGSGTPTWGNVAINPMTTAGDMIYGGVGGTPTRVAAVAVAGDIPITGAGGTTVAFGTLPGNSTVLKAPTVQVYTATPSQTGIAVITTSAAVTANAGDTYTNNGHTFTVLQSVVSSTGPVFFSGTGVATSPYQFNKAAGSGSSAIESGNPAGGIEGTVILATYITPTSPSPLYLKVKMVGAGAGGAGSGTSNSGGNGGAGQASVFGTNLLIAYGGPGTTSQYLGVEGGLATINSPALGAAFQGGWGGASSGGAGAVSTAYFPGGQGASTPFGAGGTGTLNGAGAAGTANTGSGGGGGGNNGIAGSNSGAGGSAGGYIDAIISSPASSYYFGLGLGGNFGVGGSSGQNGGPGGTGIVVIEEYYQ